MVKKQLATGNWQVVAAMGDGQWAKGKVWRRQSDLSRAGWLLACLVAGFFLVGCQPDTGGGLQQIATVQSTLTVMPLPATWTPSSASGEQGNGGLTPVVTAPPAFVLPDETGASIACEANMLRLSLSTDDGEQAAITRIDASGDFLYLLVDGALVRSPLLSVDSGQVDLSPVLAPGDQVAGRPVQELVDLAVDPGGTTIYALDKVGHVIRWEPATQNASLTYRAASLEEDIDNLPFNFMAITLDGSGRVLMLDAAHGALWTPEGLGTLEPINEANALEDSGDVATAGENIFVLGFDGDIRTLTAALGSEEWRAAGETGLGLSLRTSRHLGVEMLLLIDGLRREIKGIDPATARVVVRYRFDFPDMGLLRDAVFANGRLYGIADDGIYVYPGPAKSSDQSCDAPPDDFVPSRPSLYGENVLTLTNGFLYPIEGGTLPPWPRVYPGASRIYRMGVHHGVDVYRYNGPAGFGEGYPVTAMAAGYVEKATIGYEEMSEDEFQAMLEESEATGETPPAILERLEGKRVIIDHGNGIRSVYAHLDQVAAGVVAGARIEAGQIIGAVGVTGTQAEGEPGTEAPHLHFELWVGDRYLGKGLTLRETIWWFEQIFADATGG